MRLELTKCETPELELENPDFGETSATRFDASKPRFSVDIADQPIGLSLRALAEKRGQVTPLELSLYNRFELWVIPHRVSVQRIRGLYEIVAVTIDVRYEAEGATCSIASLFPEARFVAVGSVEASASVSLSGAMTPSSGDIKHFEKLGTSLRVGGSSSIKASLGFSAAVSTPVISASGKGSSRCRWTFEKEGPPLFGCDLETWSVVVLPKRRRSLTITMSVTTTERLAFVPVSRTTDDVTLVCPLEGAPTAN